MEKLEVGRKKTGGRIKGVPNKLTQDVKAMILAALHANGGAEYLRRTAESHPAAFLTLVGKVLPLQVTGADGEAIKHSIKVSFG